MELDRRRATTIVLGVAVAVGVLAPSSEAKGGYDARVCGRDACRVVDYLPAFGNGGAAPIPVDPPPSPVAYYRITISYSRAPGAPQRLVYAPDHQMINGFGGWAMVSARFASGMRKTLRGLAPFPARPRRPSARPGSVVDVASTPAADARTAPLLASGLGCAALLALAALSFGLRSRRRTES